MSHIEQAIRDAVEKGGYIPPTVVTQDEMPSAIRYYTRQPYRIFLDPAFWLALGKARGWPVLTNKCKNCGVDLNGWQFHWHTFIDHLIAGKDAESFFASLTNK